MDNLKELVEYYPKCLSSKERLKSFLSDQYPGEKRNINILCIMYECEMLDYIISKKALTSSDEIKLTTQLENDYGISPSYAKECIKIWDNTFDSTFKSTYKSISDYVDKASKLEKVRPHITIIKGDPRDYDYSVSSGGRLLHYKGEKKEVITIPNMMETTKIISLGSELFSNRGDVKKVIISEGIKYISNGAFSNCSSLTEITLPETLEDLGSDPKKADFENSVNAVYGTFEQTDIEKITLPENMLFLGARTFNRCCNLGEIRIPDKVEIINKSTFSGCTSLKRVTLPKNLKSIESFAFEDCPSVTELIFPDNVDSIGKNAFSGCVRLKSVKLNEKLRIIEKNAFRECSSLRKVTLPDSVSFIHDSSFDNYAIRSVPKAFTVCCRINSYAYTFAVHKGFNIELL